MPFLNMRFRAIFVHTFFRDPARPLEWLNLFVLCGCAQFFYVVPTAFDRPTYSAFAGEPWMWSSGMMTIAIAQVAAMLPSFRPAALTRFLAMAIAAGLWTMMALTFLQGDQASSNARMYGSLAFVTAITGIYLGWTSRPD